MPTPTSTCMTGTVLTPTTVVDTHSRSLRPLRYGIVWIQLVVALATVGTFRVGPKSLLPVLMLTLAGFAVRTALPPKWRIPFFAGLSIGSIPLALGLEAGMYLLGIGATLMALSHLPFGNWRLLVIAIAVGGLAVMRGTDGNSLVPTVVWPLLGSMFMLRWILFLRVRARGTAPITFSRSVAYFFMLPNVVFPLFPVVDYQTMFQRETPSDLDTIERGARWIVRGVVHLLVYRFVFLDVVVDELYVSGFADVVRWIVGTIFLYVRVSGTFHLAVGILLLFGFRLPATHHLYFLAPSLTELWRRINIYWKDFMEKAVFRPAFFALRQHGRSVAIIGATIAVFVGSWLLHSWQFFWLQGEWRISQMDTIFWSILALLMVVEVRGYLKHPRAMAPEADGWTLRRGLNVVGTFLVLATLWSLWSAASPTTWLYALSMGRHATAVELAATAAGVSAAVLLAGFPWGRSPAAGGDRDRRLAGVAGAAGLQLAPLVALSLLTAPIIRQHAPTWASVLLRHAYGDVLTVQDFVDQAGSYYESIVPPPQFRDRAGTAGIGENSFKTGILVPRADFLLQNPRSHIATSMSGQSFRSNAWGLRDREYSALKEADTQRIALLGASVEYGHGVSDADVFESLAESRLNEIMADSQRTIEIFNVSAPDRSLAQRVFSIPAIASQFDPDAIVLAVHPYELLFLAESFVRAADRGVSIPDDSLAALVRGIRLDPGMSSEALTVALRPVEHLLYERIMDWLVEEATAIGAVPAILTVSMPTLLGNGSLPMARRAAERAGVQSLECAGTWQGLDTIPLAVSPADPHPNAAGHRLLADCLTTELARSGFLVAG